MLVLQTTSIIKKAAMKAMITWRQAKANTEFSIPLRMRWRNSWLSGGLLMWVFRLSLLICSKVKLNFTGPWWVRDSMTPNGGNRNSVMLAVEGAIATFMEMPSTSITLGPNSHMDIKADINPVRSIANDFDNKRILLKPWVL